MNFQIKSPVAAAFLRRWLVPIGSALVVGSAAAFVPAQESPAADRIYLTYGILGRSIAIADLRTFADTGQTTQQLRWYLNFTGVDSDNLRAALTHEISVNGLFVDEVANTIPGEYVLYQVGRVIHTKSRVGSVQIRALRSSFVLSTIDDNRISILEFLETYPTPEVYVDGVILARLARNVSNFVDRIEPTIAVIQEFLAGLICDCDAPNRNGSSPP